jgi:hypothetical protein
MVLLAWWKLSLRMDMVSQGLFILPALCGKEGGWLRIFFPSPSSLLLSRGASSLALLPFPWADPQSYVGL